jgi:nuclear transport factor 2 (NTF2) superfamily protein
MDTSRPPLPPFDENSAKIKVRMAENGWNNKNAEIVALAYSVDSQWRNRADFITGRDEIITFLSDKWQRELDYKLIKELWAFTDNRIAVRFAYEYRNADNQWFRAYGNENWEFDELGLMCKRYACINDLKITDQERLFHWKGNIRPDNYASLSELGL